MAKSTGAFAIRITAIDGASRQLDAINKRLSAMQAPVKRLQVGLEKFTKLTGLSRLSDGFRGLAMQAVSLARAVGSIIPGLGAITGAATLAGMARLVSNWSNFGTELLNSSTRLGMTTAALQSLQGAARLAGADAGSLTSGLAHLGDLMQDAVAGRAPDAARMFGAMGVQINRTNFEARSAAEVLPQLADKIASIRNPTIQAQVATQLFGGAAERLLPFLRRGSRGIAEYQRMAREYGVTNEAGARQADQLREAQGRLGLAFEGLGNSISEHVGPVLTPLLVQFSLWIARNREWIATGIGEKVKQFGEWIKSIDWPALSRGAQEWWDKIKGLVDSVGGLENATKLLFGLWAGARLTSLLAGVGLFGTALTSALAPLLTVLAVPAAQALLLRTADVLAGTSDAPSIQADREQHPTQLGRWMYDQLGFLRRYDAGVTGVRANGPQSPERSTRENTIYDGLIARGMSPSEAAGIAANAMRESGGRLDAVNPAGGGVGAHGLFQWRADRARMRDGRLASQGNLDEQLDHFVRDREGQRQFINNSRGNPNNPHEPGTAAYYGWVYSNGFERHGNDAEDTARAAEAARIAQRQGVRRLQAPPPATAPSVNPVTAPVPGPQSSLTGSASLSIAFANAPAGMTTSATAEGLFNAPPNVSFGLPRYAAA